MRIRRSHHAPCAPREPVAGRVRLVGITRRLHLRRRHQGWCPARRYARPAPVDPLPLVAQALVAGRRAIGADAPDRTASESKARQLVGCAQNESTHRRAVTRCRKPWFSALTASALGALLLAATSASSRSTPVSGCELTWTETYSS